MDIRKLLGCDSSAIGLEVYGQRVYTFGEMKVGVAFDWDDANVSHLARHRVRPAEAEQVFRGSPLPLGSEDYAGEERHIELGETASGRLLAVVWTWRRGRIRVVTAFSPNRNLKALWKARKKGDRHGKT